MRVLITGNEGYIGSVLTGRLPEHDVIGMDTGFYRGAVLYHVPSRIAFNFNKDVRNVSDTDLENVDTVIYLSELSNDPLGQLNQSVTIENNHRGCQGFIKACKDAGVSRFIYSSSCSVYGGEDNEEKTESSSVAPLTEYSRCKIMNEKVLLEAMDDKFSPTILRNATVYGVSPSMRFDLCVNNMCGDAWIGGKVTIDNGGNSWRPLIHIDDLCDAFKYVLEAPLEKVRGKIFNVSNNSENFRIREIAEIVAKVFGDCYVNIMIQDYTTDKRSYRVSSKSLESIGFKCKKTIYDGVDDLFRVFRTIDLNDSLFNNKIFRRVNQIKYLLKTGQITTNLFWR